MLAFIRWIKKLQKREHFLRTRYNRKHPHFLLYLALDAILTISLVGGGYAIASSHGVFQRSPTVLADMGSSSFNEAQLRAQLLNHGVNAYWIGSQIGIRYGTELLTPNEVTLNYMHPTSPGSAVEEQIVSVTTYADAKDYNLTAKGPLHPKLDVSVLNARGDRVTYNRTDLREVDVRSADGATAFVIRYTHPQSAAVLLHASEELRLFS